MRSLLFRLSLVVAIALAAIDLVGDAAVAGVFSTHSRITFAPVWGEPIQQEYALESSAALVSVVPDLPEGVEIFSTHAAFTALNILDFMGAAASAEKSMEQPIGITASGSTKVEWRDVTYVAGSGPGSTIRLAFEVDGV